MKRPLKGRGAQSNPAGRFERFTTQAVDDGWFMEEVPSSRATSLEPDRARSIISTNDSPDIPFEYSINPYRGCEHGCVYCLAGDTPILMADGTVRPLARIRRGDWIYGTRRTGGSRRYVKSRVLAAWSVIKPAYRVTLADGTTVVAGADHRFLTSRGWRFVTSVTATQRACRPPLTTGHQLMGVGAFAERLQPNAAYRAGYLCAWLRAARFVGSGSETRPEGQRVRAQWIELAEGGRESLERVRNRLGRGCADAAPPVAHGGMTDRIAGPPLRRLVGIGLDEARTHAGWPASPSQGWYAGFLAGLFDADGQCCRGSVCIGVANEQLSAWAKRALRALGFTFAVRPRHSGRAQPAHGVRLLGGLRAQLRFLHAVDPASTHRVEFAGQTVTSTARLEVLKIEPLARAMRLYDLTTSSADFIANGLVSHNCYARPSHAYLGLSPGLDFETRLFYKADAARLLKGELARPGYVCKPITLGANTDPYQPVERHARITRTLLELLFDCRHPVAIVTKGTLVLRDLDLLAEMARAGLASVAVSVTTLDADLKRALEPRAAAPVARLSVIRELTAAGIPTAVLAAPVIPALTDHELESILQAARQAGASRAGYVLLRLPHEVSELFREWLVAHYPQRARHVMSLLGALRGGRDNDPRFGTRMRGTGPYAQLLRARFAAACRRLGLECEAGRPLSTDLFQPPGAQQLDLGL